jgi:hypothetical protein
VPTIFEPGMPTSAARKKYRAHKSGAEKRGIEFRLTFEEWFFIWLTSGHLHERGKEKKRILYGAKWRQRRLRNR